MLRIAVLLAALGYSITLGTVSLITITNLPDVNISFADKIFHFLAYSLFTVLWYLAFLLFFGIKKRKSVIFAVVFAILFGIVIEVLQDTMTATRDLDVYDAIANTLGALVAALIIRIKNSLYVKNS